MRTLVDVIRGRVDSPCVGDLTDLTMDAVLRQDMDWMLNPPERRDPVPEPDWPIPIVLGR